jgi:hypothetical protein
VNAGSYFKRSRVLLNKRYKFLTPEQKQQADLMLYASSRLLTAYSLKEQFFEALDSNDSDSARMALSRSQVSEMTKGLNGQVQEFRSRSLMDTRYPVIWTDALYEKVRMDGRVISMAVMAVCGVNEQGHRDVLAVEPMLDESKESYCQLF